MKIGSLAFCFRGKSTFIYGGRGLEVHEGSKFIEPDCPETPEIFYLNNRHIFPIVYIPTVLNIYNFLAFKKKAPTTHKGSKNLFWWILKLKIALNPTNKLFEHFLIPILCFLGILSNYTVTLSFKECLFKLVLLGNPNKI